MSSRASPPRAAIDRCSRSTELVGRMVDVADMSLGDDDLGDISDRMMAKKDAYDTEGLSSSGCPIGENEPERRFHPLFADV